jgi:hypothetical protein
MKRRKVAEPQSNRTRPRWEDRSIEERLLLSLIDAYPGPEIRVAGKTRVAARERRLKKAMSALFNVAVTAKEEQLQMDSGALWWMAAQQHKDLAGESGRFVNSTKQGMEEQPSLRSERQLAREAANKFYGPFDEKS